MNVKQNLTRRLRPALININTTIAGLAAAILAISSELEAIPEERRGTLSTLAIIAIGLLGIFARDGGKTSKQSIGSEVQDL